jgi:tyrosyl-tRNA synthetase
VAGVVGFEALTRGAVAVHTAADLKAKLARGKPLRVKLGVDPTAPDLHLGHTVVLRKLRDFMDAGHRAILIIGDFTARVGDPSGASKTRPQLSAEQIEAAARTYLDQVGRVLDVKRLEIRRNSEWLAPLDFGRILVLASKMTVARLLERDDFANRLRAGKPVGAHEFLYVLMQAYDSVAIQADVELGGTDQTFNLLAGRDLMRDSGLEPQVALTMPILRGLDGVEKMSKSLGNTISVAETPYDMVSKLMKIPDALLDEYATLLTILPTGELRAVRPMDAKKRIAEEVSAAYHSPEAARAALAEWERVVSRKEAPTEIPDLAVPGPTIGIVKLVVTAVGGSNSDARRLVEQGGVELDGTRITDPKAQVEVKDGAIVRIGKKRKHFKLKGTP